MGMNTGRLTNLVEETNREQLNEKPNTDSQEVADRIWKDQMKDYHKYNDYVSDGYIHDRIAKASKSLDSAEEELEWAKQQVVEATAKKAEVKEELSALEKERKDHYKKSQKKWNHMLQNVEKTIDAYVKQVEDKHVMEVSVSKAQNVFITQTLLKLKPSVEDAKKALKLFRKWDKISKINHSITIENYIKEMK